MFPLILNWLRIYIYVYTQYRYIHRELWNKWKKVNVAGGSMISMCV